MEIKHCSGCGQDKPISDYYKNRARCDGLSTWCVECQRAAGKASHQRKRLEFIEAMGGKCERCGFTDPRALQVDHINGDGRVERADSAAAGHGFYVKVLASRERYMLLCANCNQIKKVEQDETRGERVYARQTPTERTRGVGRGNTPGSRAALERAHRSEAQRERIKTYWANLSPEKREERKRKMREVATGRKLVDGHWVHPD